MQLPSPLALPRPVKQHLADMLQIQSEAQNMASETLKQKQKKHERIF